MAYLRFVIALIVLLDQLLWRPLVAWADKFKMELSAGGTIHGGWRCRLNPKLSYT